MFNESSLVINYTCHSFTHERDRSLKIIGKVIIILLKGYRFKSRKQLRLCIINFCNSALSRILCISKNLMHQTVLILLFYKKKQKKKGHGIMKMIDKLKLCETWRTLLGSFSFNPIFHYYIVWTKFLSISQRTSGISLLFFL